MATTFEGASAAAASAAPAGGATERSKALWAPKYARFMRKGGDFTQQFSHMYTVRTTQMRPLLQAAAKQKWGTGDWHECGKVVDLRPSGHEWLVIGCIYKDQPLKPSILDEYSGDRALDPPQPRANYASADMDSLVLEDESGRVALAAGHWHPVRHGGITKALPPGSGRTMAVKAAASGAAAKAVLTAGADGSFPVDLLPLVHRLVTGVVVAVRGTVLETGELAVNDVCVPGLSTVPGMPRPAPPPAMPPAGRPGDARYLLLVSGLSVGVFVAGHVAAAGGGALTRDHPLALLLLADFINGMMGDDATGESGSSSSSSSAGAEAAGAARIVRVVAAGNTVGRIPDALHALPRTTTSGAATSGGRASTSTGSSTTPSTGAAAATGALGDRSLSSTDQEAVGRPLKDADAYLAQLASSVPVDLMPGDHDPSNFMMPQQPLHALLFPQASRYSTFKCVSNPYDADVAGVRVAGTSGQPLADVARYAHSSNVMPFGDEMGYRSAFKAALAASEDDDEEEDEGVGSGSSAAAAAGGSRARLGHSAGAAAGAAAEDDADGDISLSSSSSSSSARGGAAAAAASGGAGTTGTEHVVAMTVATGGGADADVRAASTPRAGVDVLAAMKPVDILTNTLHWRHMAPTAPDTLACYPFKDHDPFVMDSEHLPHVYFSGGASEFGTRLVTDPTGGLRVRVVVVPDFAHTQTAVLINLRSPNFDAQPIVFGKMAL